MVADEIDAPGDKELNFKKRKSSIGK